jgi:NDP-sugar pyrophosphorylase family protein
MKVTAHLIIPELNFFNHLPSFGHLPIFNRPLWLHSVLLLESIGIVDYVLHTPIYTETTSFDDCGLTSKKGIILNDGKNIAQLHQELSQNSEAVLIWSIDHYINADELMKYYENAKKNNFSVLRKDGSTSLSIFNISKSRDTVTLDNPSSPCISSHNDYLRLSLNLLSIKNQFIEYEEVQMNNCIFGHHTSINKNNCYYKDSFIGNNVMIFSDVSIENSYIGDNCIICSGARIKDAIILENTVVGSGIYVDHKLISQNTICNPMTRKCITINDKSVLSNIVQ